MDIRNKAQNLMEMVRTTAVEWRPLGEVASIGKGKQLNKSMLREKDKYPVINGGINPSGYWHEYNNEAGTIVISQGGASAGFVNWMDVPFFAGAHAYTIKANEDKLLQRFAYYFLKMKQIAFMQCQYGAGIPALAKSELQNLLIPIPPLEIQQKIVKILDKFTELEAALEAALEAELVLRKRQYQYYRDFLLDFDNQIWGGVAECYKGRLKDVVWKTLGEVALDFGRGKSKHRPRNDARLYGGNIPFVQTGDIKNAGHIIESYTQTYSDFGLNQSKLWKKGTLCITIAANIAETAVLGFDACFPDSVIGFVANPEETTSDYVEYLLSSLKMKLQEKGMGSAQENINLATFSNMRFPFPPLSEQEKIAAILDKFDTLTHSISEGLPHEIALRRKQYEYYRERLLAFPNT
ncbi:restriction endonuclease subunit S [Eikenella sp. S3360]|uniref:Restriction endonuclease subunit S n=1 Tax=Eikenella glucosivorans TaxID=2766967 RepID=A0ABS0NBW4_9NEIS|nr:restriction endonuclease subunit S [Eikenella glucosivorans]MBH5329792.1 restriction endonuclease subunit S [Eikenella glucosivorans]